MRPEGGETCSEGSENEIALHKHIENHCSMDCDLRINAIEIFRQYRAMIAAVNTLTEFLLSIHYDPCIESGSESSCTFTDWTCRRQLCIVADINQNKMELTAKGAFFF